MERLAVSTPEDDPRLRAEPDRLGALVALGAAVRAAEGAEQEHLRSGFSRAVTTWLELNPPGSPAWESPLEIGLRSWNLWVAMAMARPWKLDERTLQALGMAFWSHGEALERRLEDAGLAIGSHLMGDLVGLYACGTALSLLGDRPARWRVVARARLAAEARRQVLADGGGAEASTGYSRFVAELWIAALCCARAADDDGEAMKRAARQMLRFLGATMAPDGKDPAIGDDDDSRVLPPVAREPRDLRALLPLGAALCGDDHRLADVPWSEEAAWLAGAEGFKAWCAAPERDWAASHAAHAFGLHVARRGGAGGDMVALRAGPHGQGGAGGHAHNDPLSVRVWFGGRPVVVDSGTGVYLGRRALRDRFRSAAAHATVIVDGEEPSPILPTRPFALPDHAAAAALSMDEPSGWKCVGSHRGYRRLGVRHEREVRYDREARIVEIVDRLDGTGTHEIALSFPLGSAKAVVTGEDGERIEIEGTGRGAAAMVRADRLAHLPWRIEPAMVSPAYGTVEAGVVARRRGIAQLPVVLITRIQAET